MADRCQSCGANATDGNACRFCGSNVVSNESQPRSDQWCEHGKQPEARCTKCGRVLCRSGVCRYGAVGESVVCLRCLADAYNPDALDFEHLPNELDGAAIYVLASLALQSLVDRAHGLGVLPECVVEYNDARADRPAWVVGEFQTGDPEKPTGAPEHGALLLAWFDLLVQDDGRTAFAHRRQVSRFLPDEDKGGPSHITGRRRAVLESGQWARCVDAVLGFRSLLGNRESQGALSARPSNSTERGAEVAQRLRAADPAVAVAVARQLRAAGVTDSSLVGLAASDPSDPAVVELVSTAADAIAREGLPAIGLLWESDVLAIPPQPKPEELPPSPETLIDQCSDPAGRLVIAAGVLLSVETDVTEGHHSVVARDRGGVFVQRFGLGHSRQQTISYSEYASGPTPDDEAIARWFAAEATRVGVPVDVTGPWPEPKKTLGRISHNGENVRTVGGTERAAWAIPE